MTIGATYRIPVTQKHWDRGRQLERRGKRSRRGFARCEQCAGAIACSEFFGVAFGTRPGTELSVVQGAVQIYENYHLVRKFAILSGYRIVKAFDCGEEPILDELVLLEVETDAVIEVPD